MPLPAIVTMAKGVYSEVKGFIDLYKQLTAPSNVSLTNAIRQMSVFSRVYVDNKIYNDEVTPNVLRCIHSIYAGIILNVFQLNQFLTVSKTVSEIKKPSKGSESLIYKGTEDLLNEFTKISISMENDSDDENDEDNEKDPFNRKNKNKNNKGKDKDKNVEPTFSDAKLVSYEDKGILPQGRIIELNCKNPTTGVSITMNMAVYLYPYIMNSTVVKEFLKIGSQLSFYQRILQWRAGEISFWRDLVFQLDILKDIQKSIKKDDQGIITGILSKEVSDTVDSWGAILHKAFSTDYKKKVSLSGSFCILSEETVKQAYTEIGIDLTKEPSRREFFKKTNAIGLFIIDPMYQRVTMSLNGVPISGTYSFSQFSPKGKLNDIGDFMNVVAALSQGRVPKF